MRAAGVECGLGETAQARPAGRGVWWGERQRPLQIGERRVGVEAKRAFACQRQEPPRRVFQLGCLVGVSGGVGEVKRGCVVVGKHVCDVFHPLGGLGFDPRRGGDMPCGPRRREAVCA